MQKNKIYECTIVAGKKGDDLFLFKNGDTPTLWDHEIIRDKVNDIEVVYYTNQKGWVEGMNELGIGMVFALLTVSPNNSEFLRQKHNSLPPYKNDINPYYISKKGEYLLSVISSHTLEEAREKIKRGGWYGNYYISDGKRTLEIENFYDEIVCKEVSFSKHNDYKVKTNFGELIPTAGQIDDKHNMLRANSEIRKKSAERYLFGFGDYDDVIRRMGFQEFDKKSMNNVFRTDYGEKTTSQVLLDLTNNKFYFIYHDTNEKFQGVFDKIAKKDEKYKSKIEIILYNKNNLVSSEYSEFIKKKNSLYHIGGKD